MVQVQGFNLSKNGVYRSTDNGDNWKSVGFGQPISTQGLVVIGTTLFADGQDNNSNAIIFRSTDEGDHWEVIRSNIPKDNPTGFVASGTNLFAAFFAGGIYRSSDNGTNWIAVNTGLPDNHIYSLVSKGNDLYAGLNGNLGIYKSTNYGASWKLSGLGGTTIGTFLVKDTSLFAWDITGDALFRSTDNGNNWDDITSGLSSIVSSQLYVYGGLFSYDSNLLVVAYKSNGVYRSIDDGTTWEDVSTLYSWDRASIFGFSITHVDSDLIALTSEGVFLSKDYGKNWVPKNKGLSLRKIASLAVMGSSIFEAEAVSSNILRTSDGGNTWIHSDSGIGFDYTAPLVVDGTTLYVGGGGGYIYKSTNMGVSWSNIKIGLTNSDISLLAVTGKTIIASINGAFSYRSTNSGGTWKEIDTSFTYFATVDTVIFGVIYGAGSGTILRTTDHGLSWSDVVAGLPDTIASLSANGKDLYVSTNKGLYHSSDYGANWSPINNSPFTFAPSFVDGPNFFAYNGNAVFHSRDNGTTWKDVSIGLDTNVFITALAVQGGYLFAATTGTGVWRRPLSELAVTQDLSAKISSEVSLEQNYPNPFSSTTSISFSLPHAGDISLRVFDELGNQVATLAIGHYEAGKYHADWDASNFLAGVYYCRLQAGTASQTRNIIVAGR